SRRWTRRKRSKDSPSFGYLNAYVNPGTDTALLNEAKTLDSSRFLNIAKRSASRPPEHKAQRRITSYISAGVKTKNQAQPRNVFRLLSQKDSETRQPSTTTQNSVRGLQRNKPKPTKESKTMKAGFSYSHGKSG